MTPQIGPLELLGPRPGSRLNAGVLSDLAGGFVTSSPVSRLNFEGLFKAFEAAKLISYAREAVFLKRIDTNQLQVSILFDEYFL